MKTILISYLIACMVIILPASLLADANSSTDTSNVDEQKVKHFMYFRLRSRCSTDQVLEALYRTPRILLFESKRGFVSIAQVIEWARDLGRLRADVPENIVFRDSVKVRDNELMLTMAVHQESIVVPENIDAIRAATGFKSKWDSIRKTDLSLGLITEGKRYG